MGTRAQFFIGDPRDVEVRKWLGSVAFDGYPTGDCGEALKNCKSVAAFRSAVRALATKRDDFCDPATRDFPFPWRNNLFLTDVTYAWFGGRVQMTSFHRGFVSLNRYLTRGPKFRESYHDGPEGLADNVPAPTSAGKPPGPDSIIIVRAHP